MAKETNKVIEQIREISNRLPDPRKEEIDPEIAKKAFFEIEKLGPDAIQASDHMIRDKKIREVFTIIGQSAIKYITHAFTTEPADTSTIAITLLGEIGKPAIPILSSIMQSNQDEQLQLSAAYYLALDEDGLNIVKESLSDRNEQVRFAAIHGLAQVIDQELDQSRKSRTFLSETHNSIIEVLLPFLQDKNHRIRNRVLLLIITLKGNARFNENLHTLITDEYYFEILDHALDDEHWRVRATAQRGLYLIKHVDSLTAKIFVKPIEDSTGHLSNDAIDEMFLHYHENIKPDDIANAIINELILRTSNRPAKNFNPELTARALRKTFEQNPRLYQQTLERLCDLAFENQDDVRRRSVFVAKRLNEPEFIALVHERADEEPAVAKALFQALGHGVSVNAIAEKISETDPRDVQRNAANQISLLTNYYEDGLKQAQLSFRWAIVIICAGFISLITTIYFLATGNTSLTSILTAVGSVVAEFIGLTIFWLYKQTREQVTYYHQQMNQIQRYLLANSMIESLSDETSKDKARTQLVQSIAMPKADTDTILPHAGELPSDKN